MEIYRITNLINNKKYIGQRVYNRNYYFGSGSIIEQAIKKYGKSNFKKEILWSGSTTREKLDDLEIFYIKTENTLSPIGYNICEGGSSGCDVFKNHPNKENIKNKIRQSMLISPKCKRPGKLNSQYKIILECDIKMIYELFNTGYSSFQIFSHFSHKFTEKISSSIIERIIKEGKEQNLILSDDNRFSARYDIEHNILLKYIQECDNKNVISYISIKTGHCRKAIRNMLKKHNLYKTENEIDKKIKIYLHL